MIRGDYLTARSLTSKFKVELSGRQHSIPPDAESEHSLGGDSRDLLLAISQRSGNRQFPLSTNGHAVQTLVPTLDNLSST
jgi:hypothetical protein